MPNFGKNTAIMFHGYNQKPNTKYHVHKFRVQSTGIGPGIQVTSTTKFTINRVLSKQFCLQLSPPQRFSFFTISLVHCFHEVPPWWALKEYFSNLGLQIVGKSISGIHSDFFATSFWLFLIFLGNLEFYRELGRRIHKILQVSKPKKEWG